MNEILDRLAANGVIAQIFAGYTIAYRRPGADSRKPFSCMERSATAPDARGRRHSNQYDRSQGPACAIACGAATIYRNYFAPLDGRPGQIEMRQFDGLRDVGTALGQARSGGHASCA